MKYLHKPYFLFLILNILAGLALFMRAGHTWQIYPAYFAMLIAVLILFLKKNNKRKLLVIMVLLILIALSAVSLYLFPLVILPKPSGNYQVGVRYEIIQTDRDETMTPEPGDTRTLYLKIWYPAKEGTQRTQYIEGGKKTIDFLLSKFRLSIPAFLFHHIARTKTHSYLDSPIADGLFPMVTFSHGHGTLWQSQSTSLMEELASQGIVVASIAHSHQTIFAAESADMIVTWEKIVPLIKGKIDTAKAKESERRRNATNSKVKMDSYIIDNISSDEAANEFVAIWAADISSAVDELVAQNNNPKSFFHQKLDINKIGASGMSFGGAAAVESTLTDLRIKAALNMDGMQFGNLIHDQTKAKILFLEAKKFDHNLSKYGPFFDRSINQVSCLMFNGANHSNFSDLCLVSPLLRSQGLMGKINGKFMVAQMNKIVPDFFKAVFGNEQFQVRQYLISDKIILPAYFMDTPLIIKKN